MNNNLRRISRLIGIILFVIMLIGSLLVAPIDFTPLHEQPFYTSMMQKLDTFRLKSYPAKDHVKVAWCEFSIVPDSAMQLAGYKPRQKFTEVHDPVYMRIFAINNGATTAYLVSADLLIFPPSLKDLIFEKLGPAQNDFVYFSATHTHTSVGGWDPTILGTILMGEYQENWINKVADQTVDQIKKLKRSLAYGKLDYFETSVKKFVSNRLDSNAIVDGKIRGMRAQRADGGKALMFVLGAHPTSISNDLTILSADFPGETIDQLKKEYNFSMFLAGMMGSQRFKGLDSLHNFELTQAMGKLFADTLLKSEFQPLPGFLNVKAGKVTVEHGSPQLRISSLLKVREWIFESIVGPLESEISVLQMGNVLMIGTSCDFSGEIAVRENLEAFAASKGLNLIVTSFNGEYTGYITADAHYGTNDDEEVRILNWVGPYYGAYYTEIIKGVIAKAAE